MAKAKATKKPEELPKRCHARWWDPVEKFLHACTAGARPGRWRCAAHAPDHSRIGPDGVPLLVALRRAQERLAQAVH